MQKSYQWRLSRSNMWCVVGLGKSTNKIVLMKVRNFENRNFENRAFEIEISNLENFKSDRLWWFEGLNVNYYISLSTYTKWLIYDQQGWLMTLIFLYPIWPFHDHWWDPWGPARISFMLWLSYTWQSIIRNNGWTAAPNDTYILCS